MPTLYEEVTEIMNKGALGKAALSPATKTQILQILEKFCHRIERGEEKARNLFDGLQALSEGRSLPLK